MKLILASASVRRTEILHDAGFSFTVLSSAIDETPYPGESAHDLVQRLAFAKAELQRRAATTENLLPAILSAAESYATVGEISDALRRVFGEYQESVVI